MKMQSKKRRHYSSYALMGICAFLVVVNIGFLIAQAAFNGAGATDVESYCEIYADEAPEVILNGEAEVSVALNSEYEDEGAVVEDGCEEVVLSRSGEVNTGVMGDYEILYSAETASGRKAEAWRTVHVRGASGTVYLTFDDGPGPYTAALLNILAKYNVKATFFVTCAGDDELILREYTEGHTVALHTCSHNYAYVYTSTANFFEDLYQVRDRVARITGEAPNLIRFPGGSSNMISASYDGGAQIMSRLVNEVTARGFTYFDWNVSSGDAGGTASSDDVFVRVATQLKDGGSSVVLQHDIKAFSVEAVERIIEYGLSNGFTFERLTADSFTARHGVNN